jgi:Ca2+-dependent lipid-binding protein
MQNIVNVTPQQQNPNQVIGVLIRCSGTKIECVDGLLGKSDPFLKIYQWDGTAAVGPLVWQTEACDNTRAPTFQPFPIFYDLFRGDLKTRIVVQVYDYESDGEHKFIGQFITPVEDFNEGHQFKFENPKKKKNHMYKHSGYLNIDSSTMLTNQTENHGSGYLQAARYLITLAADGLDKKDVMGKSDPFYIIKCAPENHDGSKQEPYVVARSEVIMDKINVVWDPTFIEGSTCHPLAPLTVSVYDYDENLKMDLIGIANTTLHELRMGHLKHPLIHPKKKGHIGYKNSGVLIVRDFQLNNEVRNPILSFHFKMNARALRSKDTFGKSDPYLTLSATPFFYLSYPNHPGLTQMVRPQQLPEENRPAPVRIFQTEYILNDHTPDWKEFEINVADCGGMEGNILLQVWDHDRRSSDKVIGQVVTNLIELQSPNCELRLKSQNKKRHGTMGIVKVLEMVGSAHEATTGFPHANGYHVKFHGRKISRKDGGVTKHSRNSDPYLVFEALPYGCTEHQEILRTPHIDSARNPEWESIVLETARCGGIDAPIKITCWDHDHDGSHDLVGETFLSLRQLHSLCSLQMGSPFLAGDKKTRKKRNYGVLEVAAFGVHFN